MFSLAPSNVSANVPGAPDVGVNEPSDNVGGILGGINGTLVIGFVLLASIASSWSGASRRRVKVGEPRPALCPFRGWVVKVYCSLGSRLGMSRG